MISKRTLAVAIITIIIIAAGSAVPASAAILTVTTTDDIVQIDGRCSLREAIIAANTDSVMDICGAGSGSDLIELPPGTFSFSLAGTGEDQAAKGDLDILETLTIQPIDPNGSQVYIDAMNLDRVFDLHSGILSLRKLHVSNGTSSTSGGGIRSFGDLRLFAVELVGNSAGGNGGGIWTDGPVSIKYSALIENSADGSGGGVYSDTGSWDDRPEILWSTLRDNIAMFDGGGVVARSLEIRHSTISRNIAQRHGGGLSWFSDSGHLNKIVNSTLSGNRSYQNGGGIYFDGVGILYLSSVTVTLNTADYDAGDDGQGGGIHIPGGGSVRPRNSIIASNRDFSSGTFALYAPECVGTLNSFGYNLIGATQPGMCLVSGDTTGNIIGTTFDPLDPLLAILTDNGGEAWTHLPATASPAVEAGDPTGCTDSDGVLLTLDQRDSVRAVDSLDLDTDARCDIGAVELGDLSLVFSDNFESGDLSQWSN